MRTGVMCPQDILPVTYTVTDTIDLITDLDTRLSSCYMSRQLNEDSKLLTLNDVAGSWPASAET